MLVLRKLNVNLCRKFITFRYSTRPWIRLTQALLFMMSGFFAFLIRFDFTIPSSERLNALIAICVCLIIKPLVFYAFGLDQGYWRYISARDVLRIGKTNLVASAVSAVVIFGIATGFPRSVFITDFLFALLATAGMRLAVRIAVDAVKADSRIASSKRALIYGAGEAGSTLIRELRAHSVGYHVVGFIDDNPRKKRLQIDGCSVIGRGEDLHEMVRLHQVNIVLIAVPSASGKEMVRILNLCRTAGVECKTIPTLAQIMQGDQLLPQIRDVAVEDLLGREPVVLDEEQIRRRLEGEVVLVTGAAGSIGSELCRQLVRFRPSEIVAFDISETGLFYLEHELLQKAADVRIATKIGNIQDRRRVCDVLLDHRPSTLFHAAAYKHVPLMEDHIFQAVENNILGTQCVSSAAAECGVRDFVMISSDKAVDPVNIMGATKRAAELVIQSMNAPGTKYVSVRFGNVLGSNGSVIPLFKKQISDGGPVTVTHPEMRRYFMTASEAAQLVLQAGAMGQAGEIFVLDMGTPVKIVDLAHNLILLSGRRIDTDISIKFTGLRPGEKLSEKLHTSDEVLLPTSHPKINIFNTNGYNPQEVMTYVHQLEELCAHRDRQRLVIVLKRLIPEYNPSGHLLEMVLNNRPAPSYSTAVAKAS